MGTRHLVAVQVDGEYKIAQYGQWDGYPEGQGTAILVFLLDADLDLFREKCRATQWLSEEEHQDRWVDAGARRDEDFVPATVADRFQELYPELSRDTGAKILQIVLDQPPGLKLQNSIDFAKEGLFCEYAYVIDLDANTFEAYAGFGKEPVTEGRFTGPVDKEDGYGPVQLVASWPLSAMPTPTDLAAAFERTEEAANV